MTRFLFTVAVLGLISASARAEGVSGQYLEARNTDVWTGPCFANADMNLTGKNAVLAWKVEKGSVDQVDLSGLGVVAVVEASDTLGLQQTGPAKAVVIVDARANTAQKAALVRLAQRQGGDLVKNVVQVDSAKVDFNVCECKEGGCANLSAGHARVATRCIDHKNDHACGNEDDYYPPLAKGVKARSAVATQHEYTGTGLRESYKDAQRRGAYLGSFEVR